MHPSRARAIKEALERGLVVDTTDGTFGRGEFTLGSSGVDRPAELVIRILQDHGFKVIDCEGTVGIPVPEYPLTFPEAVLKARDGAIIQRNDATMARWNKAAGLLVWTGSNVTPGSVVPMDQQNLDAMWRVVNKSEEGK